MFYNHEHWALFHLLAYPFIFFNIVFLTVLSFASLIKYISKYSTFSCYNRIKFLRLFLLNCWILLLVLTISCVFSPHLLYCWGTSFYYFCLRSFSLSCLCALARHRFLVPDHSRKTFALSSLTAMLLSICPVWSILGWECKQTLEGKCS